MIRLRALVARLRLPRCPECRTLVERPGPCSDACAEAWQESTAV